MVKNKPFKRGLKQVFYEGPKTTKLHKNFIKTFKRRTLKIVKKWPFLDPPKMTKSRQKSSKIDPQKITKRAFFEEIKNNK